MRHRRGFTVGRPGAQCVPPGPLDSLHRDFPEVHLEVYIEDIALVTFGDLETVAQRLRGFAAQARLRIEEAGLTIAWSKAAAAASEASAAR